MALERREFARKHVSLPCVVRWKHYVLTGEITNLSLGGALVRNTAILLPTDAWVIIDVGNGTARTSFQARITSRVIHAIWELIKSGKVASFGVKFEESPEEVQSKLGSLLEELAAVR